MGMVCGRLPSSLFDRIRLGRGTCTTSFQPARAEFTTAPVQQDAFCRRQPAVWRETRSATIQENAARQL